MQDVSLIGWRVTEDLAQLEPLLVALQQLRSAEGLGQAVLGAHDQRGRRWQRRAQLQLSCSDSKNLADASERHGAADLAAHVAVRDHDRNAARLLVLAAPVVRDARRTARARCRRAALQLEFRSQVQQTDQQSARLGGVHFDAGSLRPGLGHGPQAGAIDGVLGKAVVQFGEALFVEPLAHLRHAPACDGIRRWNRDVVVAHVSAGLGLSAPGLGELGCLGRLGTMDENRRRARQRLGFGRLSLGGTNEGLVLGLGRRIAMLALRGVLAGWR